MRSSTLGLATLAAPVFSLVLLAAGSAPPNYTGVWQLDPDRSQVPAGENITYEIQDDPSGQVVFTRVIQERGGKQLTSHFSCKTGGSQCDFIEPGKKAKVSLWYDGPALVILKTSPDDSSVTQWRLVLGPDGKTLNVDLEELEPVDSTKKLVFDKKVAVPPTNS